MKNYGKENSNKSNGFIPSSFKFISSCIKTASSGVRSASASVAASITSDGYDNKDQVLLIDSINEFKFKFKRCVDDLLL